MSSTISMTTSPTAASSAAASCVTVTPGQYGYVPEWACNSNYNYDPSFAGALIFAIAFGITTFVHIFQAFLYKRVRLCWVIIMGASWELTSFALRVAGTRNQQSTALAAVSQILLLLAPMWINAFDYMVLGRMIYFFVPQKQVWRIKGIKLTKIFVWLDILSFLTQAVGQSVLFPHICHPLLTLNQAVV
jgi:RTA1 like protein